MVAVLIPAAWCDGANTIGKWVPRPPWRALTSGWLVRIVAMQEWADVRVVVGEEIADFKDAGKGGACQSLLPRHPVATFVFIADRRCDATSFVPDDERNVVLLLFHTLLHNEQPQYEGYQPLLLMVMQF